MARPIIKNKQKETPQIDVSNVNNLQAELDGKVDGSQVLTDVPATAVFTDTQNTIQNNLTTTVPGDSLDATQGKALQDSVDALETEQVAQNTAIALNTAKNDYPTADSTKLAGIETGATADQTPAEIVTAVDLELGNTDWKTQVDISGKQDTLVSQTNIKSINNQSLLGTGNIDIVSGSGTTNNFNTIYTDTGGSGLVGVMDDVNTSFTVSQGQYKPGSLLVVFNGQVYTSADTAITETNATTGVINIDFSPIAISASDVLHVQYQVGVINSADTGQPDQSLTIVSDELRLTKNGQADDTVDLTPYLGGNDNANKHSTVVEDADFIYTNAHQEVQSGVLQGAKVNTDVNTGDITGTINNLDVGTTQAYRGNIKSNAASLTLIPGIGVTLDGAWKTGSETQVTVLGKGSYSIEETEVDGTFWIIADNFTTTISFSSGEYTESDAMSSNEANTTGNWTGVGGVTVASSTTQADSGTYSLALTQNTTGTFQSANNPLSNLSPSTAYNLSIRVWAPIGSLDVGLRLRQNNGAGNQTLGSGYINGNDDWQTINIPFTTLASGDVIVQLQISESEDNFVNNGNAPVTVYYDAISITQ